MNNIKEMFYLDTENIPELPETHSEENKLKEALKKLGIDHQTYLELEDLIVGVEYYSQLQGYIRGFQYAMQLAADCGLLKAGDAA